MVEVPLTEAQFAAAGQRLAAYGVSLTAPSGTLTREGITARYTYANNLLTIEVIKKPALLPVSLIESQLRNYIQKGLAELKS